MKITEIGASVERELDVGFIPYMEKVHELAELRHAHPLGMTTTFGSKDNGKFKIGSWAKAQVEDEDIILALRTLISLLDDTVLEAMTSAFPNSFAAAKELGISIDEFTYRGVQAKVGGPPDDY